jgi:hypothetical protein
LSESPIPGQGAQFIRQIDAGIVVSEIDHAWVLPAGSTRWIQASSPVNYYSDGEQVYSRSGGVTLRIEDGQPVVENIDAFRTSTGQRFNLRRVGPTIDIEFLDPQPHTTELSLVVDGAPADSLVSEFGSDAYGNIDILLYGAHNQDPTHAALIEIAPSGEVTSIIGAPSPFTATHSGTPEVLSTGSGSPRVVIESETGLELWAPSAQTDPASVTRAVELATAAGCDHIQERALPDASVEGQPVAVVDCRIGERQMSVALYRDHAAVESATTELASGGTSVCSTRVVGDDWIVLTNTKETSDLVASKLGGEVPAFSC